MSDSAQARQEVTAVVVAHNSAAVLPACLEALKKEGVPLVVVDNASRDESVLAAGRQGAAVLVNDRNEGFGRAANRGIATVETPFAFLVNPDVLVEEGAVAALLSAAKAYPGAGLLAPRIQEADGRVFFQARSFLASFLTNPGGRKVLPEGDCCAPFLSGAALLIRLSDWQEIGGFDPEIFLFYEDDDLCRRFSDAGRALVHVQGAAVDHARGGSSPPTPGSIRRRRWHLAWSRGYVARKYGRPSGLASLLFFACAKWCLAALTMNRARRARYGGSAAGAFAFLRGRSALEAEGLE